MLFNRHTTEERRRKLQRSYRGAFVGAIFLAAITSIVAYIVSREDPAAPNFFVEVSLIWWGIAAIAGFQLWRYSRDRGVA